MDHTLNSLPIDGCYFDGRSSRPHRVTLEVRDQTACLRGDIERDCPLSALRVSERSRHAARTVTFPEGACLQVRDLGALAQLLRRTGHRDSWVVRIQQSWQGALAAAAVTVTILWLAYAYLLPMVAARLARAMPPAMERRLGEGALEVLDEQVLKPSRFSDQRMAQLRERFAQLQPPREGAPPYRLLFRDSPLLGANALALPSGDIVLTDQMVRLLADDDAVMGVLAHELGHLHERHVTRRLIQGSVVTAGAALLFGDVSALLSTAPALLLDMKYSRDAEREADDYAVAMLRHNGIGREHLVLVFARLQKAEPEAGRGALGGGYLSSHPASAERIERIEGIERNEGNERNDGNGGSGRGGAAR